MTQVYEACNFQDITGQRITKVVNTLKHIEEKVEALVSAFGDEISKYKKAHPESDEGARGYQEGAHGRRSAQRPAIAGRRLEAGGNRRAARQFRLTPARLRHQRAAGPECQAAQQTLVRLRLGTSCAALVADATNPDYLLRMFTVFLESAALARAATCAWSLCVWPSWLARRRRRTSPATRSAPAGSCSMISAA